MRMTAIEKMTNQIVTINNPTKARQRRRNAVLAELVRDTLLMNYDGKVR